MLFRSEQAQSFKPRRGVADVEGNVNAEGRAQPFADAAGKFVSRRRRRLSVVVDRVVSVNSIVCVRSEKSSIPMILYNSVKSLNGLYMVNRKIKINNAIIRNRNFLRNRCCLSA